jgi:hypothetical protein
MKVSTVRNTPEPKAKAGLCPEKSAMMKVPVKTPTKSEEITSFINKAIRMATKGGSIDIHMGMGPEMGPRKESTAMAITMTANTMIRTVFFFISKNNFQKYRFWLYLCNIIILCYHKKEKNHEKNTRIVNVLPRHGFRIMPQRSATNA